MNKRNIFLIFMFIFMTALLIFFKNPSKQQYVVGVILPMEHEALNQITQGLKEELEKQIGQSVAFKIKNAQGDPNIQKAIIEQLAREPCNLLIPVGTAASQMTLSLVPKQKILCLAADPTLLQNRLQVEATALSDELSASDSLLFLHETFPTIKKITLLYSSSEKVAKEIPLVCATAQKCGLEVQKLMIQNMSELYTMSQAIAADSQAIFILKDHLIVSGIQTIAKLATMRQIPIMASDEGSVIAGAAFAIGLKEASIGQQGALIAKAILEGKSPKEISVQTMNGPFPLFVNRAACTKQGIDFKKMIERASAFGQPIYFVGS